MNGRGRTSQGTRQQVALRQLNVMVAIFALVAMLTTLVLPGREAHAAAGDDRSDTASVATGASDGDDVRTVAQACGQSPDFRQSTAMQPDGKLGVTVGPKQGGSAINSISFGEPQPIQNAKIDIGNQVGKTGAFTYQFTQGQTEVTFTVQPASQSNAPVMVPFTVNNQCGRWKTFVGGGTAAPFGGTISGLVTSSCNSLPIQGAVVKVRGTNTQTTTDSQGRYELSAQGGAQTLDVSANGFAASSTPVNLPRGGSVTQLVTLNATGNGSIVGKVTAGGQPVIGATIEIEGTTLKATSLASDGRYSIANVPPGGRKMTTTANGLTPDVSIATVCPGANVFDIRMESSSGTVSGTVQDICSRAVQGALVTVAGTQLTQTTTATGAFSFTNVPSGSVKVQATASAASGFAPTEKAVDLPARGTANVVLTMNGGKGSVRVLVVDLVNQPLSGATVRVQGAGQTTGSTATTGADGVATVADVAVGDGSALTVTVSKTGLASEAASVRVCPGQAAQVQVKLGTSVGGLKGTVLSECNGLPLAGATATIYGPGGIATSMTGTSDATGIFTIPNVPSGVQSVVTTKTNFTSDTRSYLVGFGGTSDMGTIKLAGGKGTVTGTVINFVTSQPVKDATVTIAGLTGVAAVTGADGKFTLSNVPANTATSNYEIVVSATNFTTFKRAPLHVCEGATDAGAMVLQPGTTTATLSGTVVDCGSRQGVQGALVSLETLNGQPVLSGVRTDGSGAWRIANVPPGFYKLKFSATLYAPAEAFTGQVTVGADMRMGAQAICRETEHDEIEVTLTWQTGGGGASNLDLHMSVPNGTSVNDRFHLWFRFPYAAQNVCEATLASEDQFPVTGTTRMERATLRGVRNSAGQCDTVKWRSGQYRIWIHAYTTDWMNPQGPFFATNPRIVVQQGGVQMCDRPLNMQSVRSPQDTIMIVDTINVDTVGNGTCANNPSYTTTGTKDSVF